MKTRTFFQRLETMTLLSASLVACQPKQEQEVTPTKYTLDDFSVKEIPSSNATVISPDSMVLSSPSDLSLIYDSILVMPSTRTTDNALWLLNVKNKEYRKALTIGNGPSEVNELKYLWKTGNTLHACDKTGKVLTIEVNPADLSTHVSKEANLEVNLYALCTMSDGNYLTCGREDRYHIVDRHDSLLAKTGVFPVNEVPSGDRITYMNFSVEMKASPNLDHIVCANHKWNKIEIYDAKGKLKHWLDGPIDVTSDIVTHQIPNTPVSFVMIEPNYTFFRCAHTSDKGFMVSYDGTEFVPRSGQRSVGYNNILTFDWSGRPQQIYHFEQPFWNFAYDDKTKTFYMVIETNDEYKIIQYTNLPLK